MRAPNEAQLLLIALGVGPDIACRIGFTPTRGRSHTKKGPGRLHMQGKKAKS